MPDRPGYGAGFAGFGGRAWLDTAHQGALPLVAAEAAREAIRWKTNPAHLTDDRFVGVPDRVRRAVGALLSVPPADVVLSNSASYGIHLVAQAFPWRHGDEVLVVEGDFPSNILPWLALESRGLVRVRSVRPRHPVITPEELVDALTPSTRLFCTSWVHSFSGYCADLEGIGGVCRERDVIFLVNASQGLGARPLDARGLPVDGVVSIGSKWLCGPYGTGVLWLHPALRERLTPVKSYWLAMQPLDALGEREPAVTLKANLGAAAFDLFGTANFFNFLPFAAAIEHLLDIGIGEVCAYDQSLVARLIDGLPDYFALESPRAESRRSTLVFVSHRDAGRNPEVVSILGAAGVDVSLRRGGVRLSPHLYNTFDEIDRALDVLHACPA